MEDLPKLKNGQKLRVAIAPPLGQDAEFRLVCSFYRQLDNSAFLISAPLQDGKPLPLDESKKLIFRVEQGTQPLLIAGYADDLVKDGIRRYWKIRRVEQRQLFQRADERLKVSLPVQYLQDTWRVNDEGVIEPDDGLTLDISNGGVALYASRQMEVGELCQLTLPRLGSSPDGQKLDQLVGIVCWHRETPKGSPYRHLCGLQFRFGDNEEKELLRRYVAAVKKRYKI